MMLEDVKTNGNNKDYLADVLRVRDCYTQEWVPGAPVLLRFEADDVLVLADGSVLSGPVFTERSFEESMPAETYLGLDVEGRGAYWTEDVGAREHLGCYMSVGEALVRLAIQLR